MKIQYEDEYGETIYTTTADMVPTTGEFIIFRDEEYRVKSVTWVIEYNTIVVVITQNMVKTSAKDDNNSGRLTEISNAILAVGKRQDVSEKKGRALTEQIGTIRKHINQRIQQEKKDKQ